MGDLFFFLKMIIMSFVMVLVLQVKIGNQTLEERSMDFIYNSSLIGPLQESAEAAVNVIEHGVKKITKIFGGKVSNIFGMGKVPGERSLGIKLKRSKKYLEEQVKKAEEKIKEFQIESEINNTVQNPLPPLDEEEVVITE